MPIDIFNVYPGRAPKRDEYRGNPLLVFPLGENRDVAFGVGKARAIFAHLPALIDFIRDTATPDGTPDPDRDMLRLLEYAIDHIRDRLPDSADASDRLVNTPPTRIPAPQVDALPGMTPMGFKS